MSAVVTTLYRRTVQGTMAFWRITLNGDRVIREWGIVNGKTQKTSHRYPAVQNKSPREVAQARAVKLIADRMEDGFTTKTEDVRVTHRLRDTEIRHFKTIPTNFAPQKPHHEPPTPVVDSHYIIQRKRDGQQHFALVQKDGRVKLYSRTGHEMTEHMPLIVDELEGLQLPRGSILAGEVICDRRNHDDFRATNEVCRALPLAASFAERRLPIRYMVFDYFFRDGKPLYHVPYEHRWDAILEDVNEGQRVCLPQVFSSMRQATAHVSRHEWEGLVLWDKEAPCVIRMDGKSTRHGCYKWKPTQTGDFAITGWLHGTGRFANCMGRLIVAEWQRGRLKQIGTVGTGFSHAQRIEAMKWKYPIVAELKYMFQQEDTRALREPVFLRVRHDKTLQELR